ncbi:hypothetical protein MPTA5024_38720 [Microbispora sp. ATCC PTA-5024]|nr:hypothetical protein MPTA5024_38720 [Microbispora sp. ATCC PTA-5024]
MPKAFVRTFPRNEAPCAAEDGHAPGTIEAGA